VTTNPKGRFKTEMKVEMKVEACPGKAHSPGLEQTCDIGVETLGVENGSSRPYASIAVTFPCPINQPARSPGGQAAVTRRSGSWRNTRRTQGPDPSHSESGAQCQRHRSWSARPSSETRPLAQSNTCHGSSPAPTGCHG